MTRRLPFTDLALATALGAALILAPRGDVRLPGLIKPDFTPVHLAQQSKSIAVITLAAPADGKVAFTPGKVLKGAPPSAGVLSFGELPEVDQKCMVAGMALWLTGDYAAASGGVRGEPPAAMIYLGEEQWFAVFADNGGFTVRRDTFDLSGVWAGGSDMLERALTWILADAKAEVPVNSGATWGSDLRLGSFSGEMTASATFELPAIGPCVYLAASGGDRVLRSAVAGQAGDATAAAGISGASRVVGVGDVTGDGKAELIRWDGTALTVIEPAVGAKAVAVAGAPADIRSLACLDAGVAPRSAIAAFSATAPVLLVPDAGGAFTRRELPAAPTSVGAAYAGAALDLDGDGHADLVQAFAKGLVVWSGQGGGAFAAPKVACSGDFSVIHTIVSLDADGDGRLDLALAGNSKEQFLLINQGGSALVDRRKDSGELDYHAPEDGSVAASTWDVNLDGRSDLLLFPSGQGPKTYFNRGFACFGYGRDLQFDAAQTPLAAVAAFAEGVVGGAPLDVDGDGQFDVVAANRKGEIWALLAKPENPGRMAVTVALPAGTPGPLTVSASDGLRNLGARSVGHGTPALFGKTAKGPLTLTWTAADGKARTRKVVVIKSMRVELDP